MQNTSVCRFCKTPLQHTLVDLGMSPLCESFLTGKQLNQMEPFYPLHVYVCEKCYLAQLEEYVSPQDIFSEYAYFSSYSDSWLKHAENYTAFMIKHFGIDKTSFVIELASNDGYLLQYFVEKNVPVLGIEPAENIARSAIEKGIPTLTRFFGEKLAAELCKENKRADLVLGNNVLAQVPDINDFVRGMKMILKPTGIVTMEFPHLLKLMEENQFDTIYHEHFSYFSFFTVEKIFALHGLKIFDVQELGTHGGSLRIFACNAEDKSRTVGTTVTELKEKELSYGITNMDCYSSFGEKVKKTKRSLLAFLVNAKEQGKSIAGYGAPGKGNTLLNFCGIRTDFLDYTVDRNPYKHGRFTPGTHIPIYSPEKVKETRPDYLFILPWNVKDEIMAQMSYIREWGGKFIVPIPEAKVY